MNKQYKPLIYILLPFALLSFITFLLSYKSPALAKSIFQHVPLKQIETYGVSPTPTYDPFLQPPLPSNPTEYELGRYLYWQHCMPCHGDRGQGLTDEFRGMWVDDHQNCWARGCHSGKWPEEDSFPVPTIVPALVKSDGLARFSTQQDLSYYLKTTHPPQYPGFLEDDEYHALAFFVFTMNNHLPADSTPAPTFTPIPSLPPPSQENQPSKLVPLILVGFILVSTTIIVAWLMRTKVHAPENTKNNKTGSP
jgi:hypothetical protein